MKTIKLLLLVSICFCMRLHAQVPSPEDHYGFQMGADYKLADYSQMLAYYDKLEASSDRIKKIEIGKSVLGKPMLLFFISSKENLDKLEEYKKMNAGIARARIDQETALRYSKESKAFIWVDGGMHSNEAACAQMTSELAWKVMTEESDEMKKIRDEVIFMLMPVMNPDGLDIIADWYRKNLGTPYETTSPPWLYHHYVGHDNNRDWFMNNMPETYHVNEILYNEWYPQIVYNQHQTGPSWTRIFVPPFSDPVNPRIHPGITTGTNLVGTSMANRFAMKNMSGVVSQFQYSMWWNGGGRTAPYFHNMIGILTETSHRSPTPLFYPPDSVPNMIGGRRGGVLTNGTKIFYPYPWEAGESHFRQAVEYMLTGSMAVLDYAADRRQELLYNMYKMGRDAIEARVLHEFYAYVIPGEQWDKREAVNLVNILRQGGVEVHQAEADFMVGEKSYKKGAFIAYAAQAFRPFLEDLMEKQNYPDKREYPGGPPVPPYDLAGWTLPYQMGVKVDKIWESFEVETKEITDRAELPKGSLTKGRRGYRISGKNNAAFEAVNQILASGGSVSRVVESAGEFKAGDFICQDKNTDVRGLSESLGLDFTGFTGKIKVNTQELKKPKIGLYKSWVSNMDEGWTRWLLTDYHFDWDTLHDADMRNRDLSEFDVILIPHQSPERILNGHREGYMPEAYTGGLGLEGTLNLKKFIEAGGTLITFDAASDYAIDQLGLPLTNTVRNLSDRTFFIPGSLIRTKVNTEHPLAWGMQDEVAASFNRSRAFRINVKPAKREGGNETTLAKAPRPEVDIVARYASDNLLMSGWANGEKRYIGNKAAMVQVPYGEGNVILFGFRPQFRGQPRATYKLLFNAIYSSVMN